MTSVLKQYAILALAVASSVAAAPTKTGESLLARVGTPCVTGAPASLPSEGSWEIDYANVAPASVVGSEYTVKRSWYDEHFISMTTMGLGPTSGLYGPFKCQYSCNGQTGCVSYFGQYVNVGTNNQGFQCILFNALLDSSDFGPTNGTVAAGGYNKLCNPPSSSY